MIRIRAAIFALGAISALGFEPWSLWPVTLVSLTLLLRHAGGARSWRQAAGAGWWFGLGLGCASLTWLAHAFTFQAAMPQWLGWPAVALLAAYTAGYWALSLGAASAVSRTSGPAGFALASAATFILAEWLRGVLLTGFPWNPLGVIWLPLGEMARSAAVIGALGLSGVTIAIAGLLAAITRRDGVTAMLLAPAVVVLTLALAGPRSAPDTDVPIRLVQGNIDQADKWRPGQAMAQVERYRSLSGPPGTTATPRLVFWPEAAIIEPLDADPVLRSRAASVLGPRDLLFTGATGEAGDGRYTNSVFVLDAAGRLLGRYDKAQLVPFGEYLPFAGLLERLGAARLVPGEADFVPGPGPQTLDIDGLRLGISICYEIVFPSTVIDRSHRPAFLFNPSNDAWFGKGGPEQHLAQARMRAIEQGLPVIRATSTGRTAVIRADGTIAASLPAHEAARLDTVLPASNPATIFSRWGSVPQMGAAIVMLATLLLRRQQHGRASRRRL
ncbi:apolipoprotein N-acyltransferase [Sphingobium yanoikuyae]|uniref:Apolipoprotein N-acyltransferase n=2 Tax=Sphingobium TaxID=165695 RepID=A0AA42WXM8_SPHYA|nr:MULTISPECIES: apolipoprotein N-acyltransferase [Sphingomonadales]MDH2132401.1 apolipoprotein N-acyltransferase [Sphingobium yanoikuyae]MDH2152092.1 apolipoprotein N-acyltransferase [Sphingobium yanoikuyae]MDH2167855.1 apolipoprotein N-acyltransferase [Sphingobium yanoikuyae]MDT7530069.1 apolipoprotein N-acyltransferase [Sphingopyxis sp. SE2]MDV5822120.1 apolipoprotein N-acyltransferase [Sphingobium naphthae]